MTPAVERERPDELGGKLQCKHNVHTLYSARDPPRASTGGTPGAVRRGR